VNHFNGNLEKLLIQRRGIQKNPSILKRKQESKKTKKE